MKRFKRQLPFLKSVLQEANSMKREEMLKHANADQINAMSEVVLKLLKNKIPLKPELMSKLRPHKNTLRELSKRKNSVKKRREVLMSQKGSGLIKSRSIYSTLLFKQWDAKGNEQKQNGQKQSGQKEKEKPSEEKGCHGLSTSRKGLRLQVIWSRP